MTQVMLPRRQPYNEPFVDNDEAILRVLNGDIRGDNIADNSIPASKLQGGATYDSDQIGTIKAFSGQTIPTNWVLADGASLLRSDYPDLFAAIGTVYGAADASHFNIPDLRNRFIYGANTPAGAGAVGGEAAHVTTIAEMPAHNHGGASGNASPGTDSQNAHSHRSLPALPNPAMGFVGIYNGGAPAYDSGLKWGTGGSAVYGNDNTDSVPAHAHTVNAHGHSISNQGGGAAHNNLPPYILIAQIIKVKGAYIDPGGALKGETGAQGPPGPPGESSAAYSGTWNWQNTGDASASGRVSTDQPNVWFSSTQLRLNETTAPGTDASAYFAKIKVGDIFRVQVKDDATKFIRLQVTGAGTDNGTWWSWPVTLTPGGGSGDPPTNNTPMYITLITQGAQVEEWLSGTGAPAGTLGNIGDWYLNNSNGDYYEKTATSTWTLRGNLKGPTGATGAPGTNGVDGATGPKGDPGPWKGAWAAATAYAVGDSVSYASGGVTASYRRKVAGTTAGNPATDTTNWELIASGGSIGANGTPGSTPSAKSTSSAFAITADTNGRIYTPGNTVDFNDFGGTPFSGGNFNIPQTGRWEITFNLKEL